MFYKTFVHRCKKRSLFSQNVLYFCNTVLFFFSRSAMWHPWRWWLTKELWKYQFQIKLWILKICCLLLKYWYLGLYQDSRNVLPLIFPLMDREKRWVHFYFNFLHFCPKIFLMNFMATLYVSLNIKSRWKQLYTKHPEWPQFSKHKHISPLIEWENLIKTFST